MSCHCSVTRSGWTRAGSESRPRSAQCYCHFLPKVPHLVPHGPIRVPKAAGDAPGGLKALP